MIDLTAAQIALGHSVMHILSEYLVALGQSIFLACYASCISLLLERVHDMLSILELGNIFQVSATMGVDIGITLPPATSIESWLSVLAYFITALACLRARRVAQIGAQKATDYQGPSRRTWDRSAAYRASIMFWSFLFVVFIALGLSKQFHLQNWLTEVGRKAAQSQGWYEGRRWVQGIVLSSLTAGGLVFISLLLHATRRLMPRHALAFFGIVLLAGILFSQASSFHYLESFLRNHPIYGVRINEVIEFVAVACVAACAVMSIWWRDIRPASTSVQQPNAELASREVNDQSCESA